MRRIRTLDALMSCADRRKAVTVVGARGFGRVPAAFVIGMPARVVWWYIGQGLYEYRAKGKAQRSPACAGTGG